MIANQSEGVLQVEKQSFHPTTVMVTHGASLHPANYHNLTFPITHGQGLQMCNCLPLQRIRGEEQADRIRFLFGLHVFSITSFPHPSTL